MSPATPLATTQEMLIYEYGGLQYCPLLRKFHILGLRDVERLRYVRSRYD
ncbi:MAG: hypothetical protein RMY27_06900 [Nostoc sp. DedQUE09]|nr:hypothetical protein [Nostoc sp. DedQUE09]MDZ7950768.1 hypothetical protein [Nostoc sp. DedQUE09]